MQLQRLKRKHVQTFTAPKYTGKRIGSRTVWTGGKVAIGGTAQHGILTTITHTYTHINIHTSKDIASLYIGDRGMHIFESEGASATSLLPGMTM